MQTSEPQPEQPMADSPDALQTVQPQPITRLPELERTRQPNPSNAEEPRLPLIWR
jgi:hypothetical protein